MTQIAYRTVEFSRFGGSPGMLSPDNKYIRTCGWDTVANQLSPRLDHEAFQRSLNMLRYRFANASDEARAQTTLADEASAFLDGIQPEVGRLLQIDLVTNAAELWAFPFEACFAKFDRWLQDLDQGVVITRRVRGNFSENAPPWPVLPRVLFMHAPVAKDLTQALIDEHVAALSGALAPWSRGKDVVATQLLAVREISSLNDLTRHRAEFKPTYVHVLAHGAPAPPDPLLRDKIIWGLRLGDVTQPGVPPADIADALQPRDGLPLVVTLTACDSGNQANPVYSTESVVQELHRCGVPVVIGSQLPLTKPGSSTLTAAFYEKLLQGEDVRVALHAARIALRKNEDAAHDWLSLVGYVRLPPEGYASYLEEVGLRVDLRLLDAIQALADRLADRGGSLEDFQSCGQRLRYRLQRLNVRRQNLAHRPDLREESSGLEASAYKRLAELLFVEGRQHLELREADWRASVEALRNAFDAYRTAYEADLHSHWLGMQQLALDAALHGTVSSPSDWAIVSRAAEIARDRAIKEGQAGSTGQEVYWAYGTLTELALIAPRAGGPKDLDKAKANAALLVASSRQAGEEFPIQSTRRQINRYVQWWTNDHGFFPNGNDLSSDARELLTALV